MLRSALILSFCGPVALLSQESSHTLRGTDVSIFNIAGEVRLTGGGGSDVQVRVTRRGADAGDLRIEAGPIGRRETLRVIYPADRIVYRTGERGRTRTTLRVNDDGTFGSDWRETRGRRVEVRSDGSGMDASADLEITVPRGKQLNVNLVMGSVTVRNVDGELKIDTHSGDVTTDGTKGTLDLDTGSGTVTVRNAEGQVTLDTGSGDVEVDGVVGDVLTLDTGSGSVRVSAVKSGRLRLDTGSGPVTLRAADARDIQIDTGSGRVDVELVADVDRLTIDSGSGGITLGVPESLGAELRVESSSGGIDLDIPIEVRRTGRRNLSGSLGDGRGQITIDTGSGGVRLRRSASR